MNINRMTDEELVREIAGRCITNMAAVDLAKFIRRCVKESQKEVVEALKIMIRTHGMHGPCENNNCQDCSLAYTKAKQAIAIHTALYGDTKPDERKET